MVQPRHDIERQEKHWQPIRKRSTKFKFDSRRFWAICYLQTIETNHSAKERYVSRPILCSGSLNVKYLTLLHPLSETEGFKSTVIFVFFVVADKQSSGYKNRVALQRKAMPSKLQDYEILCEIGSGSYGTCKKVRRRSDNKVKSPLIVFCSYNSYLLGRLHEALASQCCWIFRLLRSI